MLSTLEYNYNTSEVVSFSQEQQSCIFQDLIRTFWHLAVLEPLSAETTWVATTLCQGGQLVRIYCQSSRVLVWPVPELPGQHCQAQDSQEKLTCNCQPAEISTTWLIIPFSWRWGIFPVNMRSWGPVELCGGPAGSPGYRARYISCFL